MASFWVWLFLSLLSLVHANPFEMPSQLKHRDIAGRQTNLTTRALVKKCHRHRHKHQSSSTAVQIVTSSARPHAAVSTSRIVQKPSNIKSSPPPATSTHTTQKSVPSSTPPPPPPSSNNPDINAYLKAHNDFRAKHGAAPLVWDTDMASKASQWTGRCKFQHSQGSLGPYGENLAAGTGGGYGIPQAVKAWTDEASQYDPKNPIYSHFTQVVWKSSKRLGCAVHDCSGLFDASYGPAHFYACEYYPAGNVIGQFA